MKPLVRSTSVLLQVFLLAGCCPSGCFVLHGEAYRALAHPKPLRDFWESADGSAEGRKRDWISCGGDERGVFTPRVGELEAERRPGENLDLPSYDRLIRRVEICMFKKGYWYTGECTPDPGVMGFECQMRRPS